MKRGSQLWQHHGNDTERLIGRRVLQRFDIGGGFHLFAGTQQTPAKDGIASGDEAAAYLAPRAAE